MGQETLRVLHVTEVLVGGVATYLNTLLPFQVKEYGEGRVGLLCPSDSVLALSPDLIGKVKIFTFTRDRRGVGALLDLRRRYAQVIAITKPPVIHLHSSFAGVIGRVFLGAHSGSQVVYTPHGWAFSMQVGFLRRCAYALIERVLLCRTDRVIVVSKFERRLAQRFGLPLKKISTVYSGLPSPEVFSESRSTAGCLNLIFVGRPDKEKGLGWILEVFSLLPQTKFYLTVVGAADYPEYYQGARSVNIDFKGWCSPQDVDALIGAADVVVVPSYWEAFGYSALEGMRQAKAVMASNRGALPELVVHGTTGIVFELERPQTLVKALLELSYKEMVAYGNNGFTRFEKIFSAAEMSRNTANIYKL